MRALFRGTRGVGVASALYVLLAFASFYPQSVRPRDTIAYVGDSLESVYLVAWNVHQVFRAPARLFDANVLFPHRRTLAFTDHRLLPSVAVAPVLWATGNPVLATNVAVGLVCLLAALGGRRLALVLGLPPVAAWAAGALYAFHTYQVNEGPRLNIVAHGFVPFALAELVLYLGTGEPRRAWRTAGFMLLQGLSSNYHLLYGTLVLGLVLLGALAARPRLVLRRLPALALAATVAGALFAPIAVPYFRAAREHGYVRDLAPGIGLEHYVSTSPTNLAYGAIGTEVRLQQRGPHFVGFVSLGLALLALAEWARRRPREAGPGAVPPSVWVPAAALLALVLVLLSLGPDLTAWGHRLGPGPYRVLHRWVPGFQLVRIPERLALLAMLFVALLAGRALSLLEAAGARVAAVLLAALMPLEHIGPLPLTERVPVTRRVPDYARWLATSPARAIAEVPIHGEGLVREETEEMYLSAYHWKPIIHGYTAYPPLLSRVLRRAAAQFPSETALQVFARIGVDTVVVHHGRPVGVDLARRLRETGDRDPATLRRLLHLAELDLFDRLPAALASGRIERLARFDAPPACTRARPTRSIACIPGRPRAPRRFLRAAGFATRAGATARSWAIPSRARTATCPRRGGSRGSCWATSSSRSRSTSRGRSRASSSRSAARARSRRVCAWPAASRAAIGSSWPDWTKHTSCSSWTACSRIRGAPRWASTSAAARWPG